MTTPFGTRSAVGPVEELEPGDFRVEREVWPDELPREPAFPYGKRPVHEHVRLRAEEAPDAPALTFCGRTLTRAELDRAVDAFARTLAARGYGPGDVLALYLQNCPQFYVAYHGANRAGLVVAPLNPQVRDIALEHLLSDSGADILVTHTDGLDVVESVEDTLDLDSVLVASYRDWADLDAAAVPVHPVVTDEAPVPAGREQFVGAVDAGRSSDASLPEVGMADLALYQYTGGTSGMPKGCRHTHWNVFFKAVAGAQGVLQTEGQGTQLAVMPIFHVAGKRGAVDQPAIDGTHVVLQPRYDPERMLAAIDAHNATSTWLTVPMAEELVGHDRVDDYDLTSLSARRDVTVCTAWGTTLTEELSERWAELTGARLHTGGYGLSETHTGDSQMAEHSRVDSAFVGQPTYGVEVEIRDFETGEQLPTGEVGEIVVRTPSTMLGYLGRPDRTAEVLDDDGWLRTGDRGQVTDEGFFYFHGRQKDVVKVSGHTVAPREVQQALERSGLVADSVVVGKPHDTRGHVLEAHVLPAEKGVTADDIHGWTADHLAEYKRPKSVVFRESFPRTDIGKVDRVAYYEELPDDYA